MLKKLIKFLQPYAKYLRTTTKEGRKFNKYMLTLNILFILILILEVSGFNSTRINFLEIILGIFFAGELFIRFTTHPVKKGYFFLQWLNLVDLIVVVSVFAKYLFIQDSIWIHVISGFRILRFYRILVELSAQNKKFHFYYEIIRSLLNLSVFIFIMSEIVFQFLGPKNESINNFVDALYFTITTLTTTGFGDITVQDKTDKLLVIFIMIFGAALFLRLATNLFRARKVFFRCKHCGLTHHEPDAVHCKHCGEAVNIRTRGEE